MCLDLVPMGGAAIGSEGKDVNFGKENMRRMGGRRKAFVVSYYVFEECNEGIENKGDG